MAGPAQFGARPFIILWLPILLVSKLAGGLTHHFLDGKQDYCNAEGVRRMVTDSLRVDLSRNPLMFKQKDFVRCTLTLQAPKGFHLILSWSNFYISQKNCQSCGYVRIFEKKPLAGWSEKLSGMWTNGDIVSSGRTLRIYYQGWPYYDTMSMTVTAYRDPSSEGTCQEDEYLCHGKMKMCIPFTLVCNGENNCGVDNINDETNVLCRNEQNTIEPTICRTIPVGLIGALGGILITGSFLAVLAITLCVLRKRRQREAAATAQSAWANPQHPASKAVPNEYLPLPMPLSQPRDQQTQSESELLVPPSVQPLDTGQPPVTGIRIANYDGGGRHRHFVDPARSQQLLTQSHNRQVLPVPLESTGPVPPARPDIEYSEGPLYVNIPGGSSQASREHFVGTSSEEQHYVNVPQSAGQHYVNIP